MKTNRRDFLKTLGGIAAFTIVPRHVLGNGFIAPSDQLTKGIIGTGGMGRGHVDYAGTRLVAVCDVDKNHLELGKQLVKDKIAAYAKEHFGELGGFAQQYLFYYGKSIKMGVK